MPTAQIETSYGELIAWLDEEIHRTSYNCPIRLKAEPIEDEKGRRCKGIEDFHAWTVPFDLRCIFYEHRLGQAQEPPRRRNY